MVMRKFLACHGDSVFNVDYDTEDGFEVFKMQLYSLTSIAPDEQEIFGDDDDRVVSDDVDISSVSEKIRLVSTKEITEKRFCGLTLEEVNDAAACVSQTEAEGCTLSPDNELVQADENLARILQAEEEALLMQEFVAREDGGHMEQKVQSYLHQVFMYEDPYRQEMARKTVPLDELEEKALVLLAKEGLFQPSRREKDHAFLLQLLFWFKESFRWINEAPCDNCGNKTRNQGMGAALESEIHFGASRVELYWCDSCSMITRFPRFNDPLKLIYTRRGRCGEWANCFTFYCRTFGYDARLILDFTDHVWTECFSDILGRWMHLDPCEGVYDKPLLYENGWNKKLNYVIAIAKDGVYDVTKRYTRKWPEVLCRRNMTKEDTLLGILSRIRKECRKTFPLERNLALVDLDRKETEELERQMYSKQDASVSLPGRRSGDKSWRILRQEVSSSDDCSLMLSSCPTRTCIDQHVANIYNAFTPILSSFVEYSLSSSKAVEILESFRKTLLDLQRAPFHMRKTLVAYTENVFCKMFEAFSELLDAISLKSDKDADGGISICSWGNPVRTSLALPVALCAIDKTVYNLNTCEKFSRESLSPPLLKLNRLHSGSVLASGEELPFGIATSAFDGIISTKWEEPNGAKGCWLTYKVHGDEKHDLVAYEFTSANDAPERDPSSWVVEGREDDGSSWHSLDSQNSQVFDKRFESRMYQMRSERILCNTFRFRFIGVRDAGATCRVQIACIDLYGKKK